MVLSSSFVVGCWQHQQHQQVVGVVVVLWNDAAATSVMGCLAVSLAVGGALEKLKNHGQLPAVLGCELLPLFFVDLWDPYNP